MSSWHLPNVSAHEIVERLCAHYGSRVLLFRAHNGSNSVHETPIDGL